MIEPDDTLAGTAFIWIFRLMFAAQVMMLMYVLGSNAHATYQAKRAVYWPTTDGVVIESAVGNSTRHCSDPLHFRYTYTVENHPYTGNNYHFPDMCGPDVPSIVAAYPVDKHLPVHYNPRDPEQSVIVPGGRTYTFFFTTTFALLGLGCLGRHLQRRRDARLPREGGR